MIIHNLVSLIFYTLSPQPAYPKFSFDTYMLQFTSQPSSHNKTNGPNSLVWRLAVTKVSPGSSYCSKNLIILSAPANL